MVDIPALSNELVESFSWEVIGAAVYSSVDNIVAGYAKRARDQKSDVDPQDWANQEAGSIIDGITSAIKRFGGEDRMIEVEYYRGERTYGPQALVIPRVSIRDLDLRDALLEEIRKQPEVASEKRVR